MITRSRFTSELSSMNPNVYNRVEESIQSQWYRVPTSSVLKQALYINFNIWH